MLKVFKIFLYSSFLLVLTTFTACEDYLDKTPNTDVSPDDAFKNFYNFQGFVEELYHCIPDFNNQQYNNSFNWGEEEHYAINGVNQGIIVSQFDLGNFWAWQKERGGNTWFDQNDWSTMGDDIRWRKSLYPLAWYGIAKVNIGIANLDKMSGTQEEKDLVEGQLYFFRGWFHFQLIQYFGGLPYIDEVIDVNEKIELPRLSYHACADKAAADFQRAVELLPEHWNLTSVVAQDAVGNDLRINKLMALAYLGKNYLWAASPLMNKESTGNEAYNEEYCKLAADAFGELLAIVESGRTYGRVKYGLLDFGNTDLSGLAKIPFNQKYGNEYMQNWLTNGSGKMPGSVSKDGFELTEAIFRGPYWGGTGWSMHQQYLAANILMGRSWSFYPTANYANYFGMENGLPINEFKSNEGYLSDISDGTSGYDTSFPWKDRDPRFYVTYGFDTQKMVETALASDKEGWRYANLYTYDPVDNASTYRNPTSGSTTGYLLMKYSPYGFNQHDGGWNNDIIHTPWVRLADVYLMYAEAVTMGFGTNGFNTSVNLSNYPSFNLTPLEAVNKIRARSHVGNVADRYLNNRDDFMMELRRERAVELAFEGHRFNDLRRWLLLTKAPYTYKKAIEFTRKSKTRFNKNNPIANEVLNLKEEIILERKYDNKHYWFPLKKADTYMYLEFEQNPGW